MESSNKNSLPRIDHASIMMAGDRIAALPAIINKGSSHQCVAIFHQLAWLVFLTEMQNTSEGAPTACLFLALKRGRVSLVGDEGFDMISFNDFVQFGTLIHMDSNFLAIICL